MAEKLWTPAGAAKKQTFGFPPGIMVTALQAARRANASAEMPAEVRERKRRKRRAAKQARKRNR